MSEAAEFGPGGMYESGPNNEDRTALACICCREVDDRTRLGGLWCLSCFALNLWERLELQRESDDVEGYRKAA